MSSHEFYLKVETELNGQQLPVTKIARAGHRERGIFSAAREYLRVQNGNLVFDICAAPFGTNFFVSWWLYHSESSLRSFVKSTRIGAYISKLSHRQTFFEIDSETMFKECVHQALMETLDRITQEKGFKLSDTDKQIKNVAA